MSDTLNPHDANARLQAEVDRLRAEAKLAGAIEADRRDAEQRQRDILNGVNERLRDELDKAKAWMANAIIDGKIVVEPSRPAAMLWTDATEWHAYERWEDADRDRYARAKQPPLMVVKSWTWHGKEDADGIADRETGG